MFKKIANPLIAVLLSLAMLGATVGLAAAKSSSKNDNDISVGDKVNMSIKGAGVMSRGQANFEGDLELARATSLDKEDMTSQSAKWVAPFLNVGLISDESGATHDHLNGNAVIFFNISKSMDSAIMSGRLAIYKFDETRDMWVRLPTRIMGTEAIARAQGLGTYAFGWAK